MTEEDALRIEREDPGTLRLAGEVDHESLVDLQRAVEQAAGDAPLTLELTDVAYIDSIGVGYLFGLARSRPLVLALRSDAVIAPVIDITQLGSAAEVRLT